jgi:hypothetical protein
MSGFHFHFHFHFRRLTSAWNWCSKLEKKSYYRVFLLCGFNGFDGDWK